MVEFVGVILALGLVVDLILMGLRARRRQEEVRQRIAQRLKVG